MTLDTLDALLRQTARTEREEGTAVSGVLQIEALVELARNTMLAARQGALEQALSADPLLRELLALSHEEPLEDEHPLPVPHRVLERVYALGQPRASFWGLSMRILRQGLELLGGVEDLLSARPLAVRGAVQAPVQPDGLSAPTLHEDLTFARQLPPYEARFTVQRVDHDQVSLALSLTQEQAVATGFEVELWHEDRLRGVRGEQEGVVVFPYVRPGTYRLNVKEGARLIGTLELALMS